MMNFSILCTPQGSIFVQEHNTNRRVTIIEVALFWDFMWVFFSSPLHLRYSAETLCALVESKDDIRSPARDAPNWIFFSYNIGSELDYRLVLSTDLTIYVHCIPHCIANDLNFPSSCKSTWHYNYSLLINCKWKRAQQKQWGLPMSELEVDQLIFLADWSAPIAILQTVGCAASASLGGGVHHNFACRLIISLIKDPCLIIISICQLSACCMKAFPFRQQVFV